VFYQCQPSDTSIFAGLGMFSFDNGTHGTFNVNYPDVISRSAGAQYCLKYSGLTANYAGLTFEGLFPGGTATGHLVNLGFPFETVYPSSMRDSLMQRITSFFEIAPYVEVPQISVSGDTLFSSAASNQWFFNGNPIAGDSGSYVVMLWSGSYSVMAIDGDCYSDTSGSFFHTTTGIASSDPVVNDVQLFPNPAHASASLSFFLSEERDIRVYIMDMNGSLLVKNEYGSLSAGAHSIDLNLGTLDAGTYLVGLYTNESKLFRKLVIE
jgi:hypothetical protein